VEALGAAEGERRAVQHALEGAHEVVVTEPAKGVGFAKGEADLIAVDIGLGRGGDAPRRRIDGAGFGWHGCRLISARRDDEAGGFPGR
jgi:hypothetical protein